MLRQRARHTEQGQEPLQSDKNGDAHDQGQDSDYRAATAAAQVQPGVVPLKAADFLCSASAPLHFNACSGHGGHRGDLCREPCRRGRRQEGEHQRNGGTEQQIGPLSFAVGGDHALQLLRILGQEHLRRQLTQGSVQDAFGGQPAQQQPRRDANDTEQQNLCGDHGIELSSLRANGPQCAVLPDSLRNGDFQNVVNHQASRQKDQRHHQYTDHQQPGETRVIHPCQF